MDVAADNAQARLPGAVLAAERERQGLGPADIAQRLHMSVWQVEALEVGDYEKLPRGTFLRGFVRNYAKVVGLPPEDLLARLADAAPRYPAPRIVVPTQNIRFDPLSERMSNPYVKAAGIASLVLALGFAAMYWWVFVRAAPPAAAAVRKPAEPPVVPPSAVSPPVVATAPAPAAVPPPPAIAAAPVEKPVEKPAEKPAPASASATSAPPAAQAVAARETGGVVKLKFKGKSWVEVRDARGKVLLSGINDPGSETEVAGKPPLKVVVGNAPEVRLFFNDRELDLEPHMREAVARVTLE